MTKKKKCLNSRLLKSRDLPMVTFGGIWGRGQLWLQNKCGCELFSLVCTDAKFLNEFIQSSIYYLLNMKDKIKMTEGKVNPASVLKEIMVGVGEKSTQITKIQS